MTPARIEEFRATGHRTIDAASGVLARLESGPAFRSSAAPAAEPDELEEVLARVPGRPMKRGPAEEVRR